MRAVVQRVSSASLAVEDEIVARIGGGLVVLLGVATGDSADVALRLAVKVARLRIFPDDAGRFDRSVLDVGGDALVVSQFTLIADSRRQKGTRPDFSKAAKPEVAEPLYERTLCGVGEEVHPPAVDGQCLSGDKARFIGRQEEDSLSNLAGLPQTSHGILAQELLALRRVVE